MNGRRRIAQQPVHLSGNHVNAKKEKIYLHVFKIRKVQFDEGEESRE
jgi:hypothetical protein